MFRPKTNLGNLLGPLPNLAFQQLPARREMLGRKRYLKHRSVLGNTPRTYRHARKEGLAPLRVCVLGESFPPARKEEYMPIRR